MNVYADNAATTAVSRAACAAMTACLESNYGNPSSIHTVGRRAAKTIAAARESIAGNIGAATREIYFTSGGAEADNWAIHIAATIGAQAGKRHIVASAFEHHAVLDPLERLKKQGYEITLLPVHSDGLVRLDELADALREDTALVTVMYANNEIGTVQPIAEIGGYCRERGILFHTDAIAAAGYAPLDVQALCVDMLSLSAHKFHGPKGVGALYCRKGVAALPLIEGGAQERGRRGGTENVPGIAGMAAAFEETCRDMPANNAKLAAMRDRLVEALGAIKGSRLNGHPAERLPNIVNVCFEGIENEALLLMLDMAGIYASSGSACTSGSLDASHVLLALGLSHELARSALRISLGAHNTPEEVEHIITSLPLIVKKLRV